MLRGEHVLRGAILLLVLWVGACTSGQTPSALNLYDHRPTEVDAQYNRLTSATRYQSPRFDRHYHYDKTEVDLARPLELPAKN